jgi:hypothetical protein
MKKENIENVENVEEVAPVEIPVETPVVSVRDKQVASMKARWQDPQYRQNVADGRAKAKAAKLAAEAAAKAGETPSTPAETPAE